MQYSFLDLLALAFLILFLEVDYIPKLTDIANDPIAIGMHFGPILEHNLNGANAEPKYDTFIGPMISRYETFRRILCIFTKLHLRYLYTHLIR